MNNVCIVALGSNLPSLFGAPVQSLGEVLVQMGRKKMQLTGISRFYQSPAFPAGAGPDYVNAVVTVRTSLPPHDLLATLHQIEADFGRQRIERWGTRTLDLDLLAYADQVLPDAETFRHWHDLPLADQSQSAPATLILPHPRLQDRAFVLKPLLDIAPDWCHPLTGLSVAQMFAQLSQSAQKEVRAL